MYCVWKRRKAASPNTLDNEAILLSDRNENNTSLWLPKDAKVDLVEVKAKGRFGKVWKGQLKGKSVAVKILTESISWLTEKEIYGLSGMNNHDNILKILYVDKRAHETPPDNRDDEHFSSGEEFWLITEFHDRGSLHDVLKSTTISLVDLVKIALSMTQGLAFLHGTKCGSGGQNDKPIVAHRDFKSKNVLIKPDMTACIADFGFALTFEPGVRTRGSYAQVFTLEPWRSQAIPK